ncbi:hypothetical protein B0H14DRAFT_3499904 [Mycena olivaceomarginata]|nr:hypothetical protein B0H14DRAFT_3499904 [Mycena olivaceomarginata]
MSSTLTPTNLSTQEMIPDSSDPTHDPQYWCLPPLRDKPSERHTVRGHQTMRGCIAEWQEHCILGVHPHPVEPQHAAGAIQSMSGPPKAQGRRVDPELQAQLQQLCMPNLGGLSLGPTESEADRLTETHSIMSISSVTAWDEVPNTSGYFALWGGGRIVYTDRAEAKAAFVGAETDGKKPQILSTPDYEEAQAFSKAPIELSDRL